MARRVRISVVAILLALSIVAIADAQRRRGGDFSVRTPTPESFDGRFNFCRIAFSTSGWADYGGNWFVDYPRADINLSIRLSELTKTEISMDAAGDPNYLVMRLTDPALFQCPFIMMTEVGRASFSPEESEKLREYLLKGGFLWADDFWGTSAWQNWESEFSKVLPRAQFPMRDLPPDHPFFRTQFTVNRVPQIPSIQHWMSYGDTSERGADSAVAHARGIADAKGRLMVLITYNTDLGDSWEREGDDPRYFYTFSVEGYAFGINALLYAMTH
jgi:hypothetical protein